MRRLSPFGQHGMPHLQITIRSGDRAGEVLRPERDIVIVGCGPRCDLTLKGPGVADEHCRLVVSADAVRLDDLESPGGSLVMRGNRAIFVGPNEIQQLELESGDVVRLGSEAARTAEFEVAILRDEEPAHVVSVRPIASLGSDTGSAERNLELLRSLGRVHHQLSATRVMDDALTVIVDAALTLVPRATHATLLLREAEADADGRGAAYLPAVTRVRGADGKPAAPGQPVPVTRSVFRKVIRERAAVLATDAPSEAFSSESLLGANIKSTIGVPLWRQDQILGVLQVDNRDRPALFDMLDLDALAVLGTNASLTLDNARLIQRLQQAESQLRQENQYLRGRQGAPQKAAIVGQSPALRELLRQLDKVANTRVTVLIEGETGTGKELVAAALHARSRRHQRLFVAQNCAAIPKDLLESELFGHKKGAFTGASEDKRGLFELAEGGTLFLDEIAELPLELQAKLLRVLQEREIRPLGASRDRRVDVRVVAACNKNLAEEVKNGRFREDLYYRLHVFPLKVPALRERRDDIPLLAQHFLKRYAREYNVSVLGFAQETLGKLARYAWPGNVRELENEVQRLVIQAEPDTNVGPELLSQKIRMSPGAPAEAPAQATLKQMTEQFERQRVLEALERHANNKTQAAKSLGITREGLHKKLKQLGID